MRIRRRVGFSALQRAENSSIVWQRGGLFAPLRFSALQRAENSSIFSFANQLLERDRVSVLFSEPKSPQFTAFRRLQAVRVGFSALQRAENSSMGDAGVGSGAPEEFQCSSASRKFLNALTVPTAAIEYCFSALQRAENSSIERTLPTDRRRHRVSVLFSEPKIPQCRRGSGFSGDAAACFSALQRAENSSIHAQYEPNQSRVRFQCSSASRKFLNRTPRASPPPFTVVSVLFSEPKIPQFAASAALRNDAHRRFSALQRAENSSIKTGNRLTRRQHAFQCSSASRKFLNNGHH